MVTQMQKTDNVNVRETEKLITPGELQEKYPLNEKAAATILEARSTINSILEKKDSRILAIVGPCSIHDEKAALEYAGRLAKLHEEFKDSIYIIMRVYFEKPRTTIGWKGLINDPSLDGTNDVQSGLHKARKLLLDINSMGLPTATELLDPIVPQFITDLISWTAIGARTTESQTHREMASGLSMPVGFKNNTDGNMQAAVDAMQSSFSPHSFLGINHDGQVSVVKTGGNRSCHVILRGGRLGPNYDETSVKEAMERLTKAGVQPMVMVDCSHANSNKVHSNQIGVCQNVVDQRAGGNDNIIGVMLESNLFEGNQKVGNISDLKYGVSITDACISWEDTEKLLRDAYNRLKSAIPG